MPRPPSERAKPHGVEGYARSVHNALMDLNAINHAIVEGAANPYPNPRCDDLEGFFDV